MDQPYFREDGAGPGVVCIHANASTSAQWRGLLDLLAPRFRALALVGHSYGAAVALIAAMANPARVRAMALYEPTLFAVLDQEKPPPNDADGIRSAVADSALALDAGNHDRAAERFIDYWMGAGSWQRTPDDRKVPIAASCRNVRRWGHALTTEPTLCRPSVHWISQCSTWWASAHNRRRTGLRGY